jgi:phospholipid/cholesterol/gamma-HCH transport system substrate-binding protein
MGKKGIETMVGVFVLLGMAGIVFLALKAANLGSFSGGITLDAKTFQGVVRLEMERNVQFPSDSSARILTSGLLGDQYVGLEAGAEEKVFAAGDTIKSTQSAVVLESLISQFLFSKAADAGSTAAPAGAGAKK